MNYEYIFKYIIIGDSGVGKSCLLLQFLEGSFKANHEATIGVEFGTKIITTDNGTNVKLQVWDTAGQDAFKSITRSYYRNAAGALVVYDITNKQSFINVKKWLEEAQVNGNKEMVLALVGNKSDLESKRQVSQQEGLDFANKNGLIFIETSAVSASNVSQVFMNVASQIIRKINSSIIDPSIEEFGVRKVGTMGDQGALRRDRVAARPSGSENNGGCC